MPDQSLKIFLIEDDLDDVELLKEAFINNNISFSMEVIMEGDKVEPYLENYTVFPSIIVMDLNLPKMNGKEILKIIKSSAIFKAVPLIVLSTSASKDDIEYSYAMGAAKFITKPVNMEGWDKTVELIAEIGLSAT